MSILLDITPYCPFSLQLTWRRSENVKNPEIRLASSNPVMQRIYIRFGFKACSPDRPFAIGSLQRSPHIETDTASWMVNFDWGDNGLRLPFLDQEG
jgi:hypothetical protein